MFILPYPYLNETLKQGTIALLIDNQHVLMFILAHLNTLIFLLYKYTSKTSIEMARMDQRDCQCLFYYDKKINNRV